MPDLLIELFSEEIPARMQARASADLKRLLTDGLVEAGLTYQSAGAFATPRRLALSVSGLTSDSPDTRLERKGPRTDAPEKALAGFLRATGLSRDQLTVRADKKGDVFFAVIEKPGRPAAEIVAEVLVHTIRNFPWPKSMRWGAGSLKWVRPLHSVLCILSDETGAQVVPLTLDGISAGDQTCGHRFMSPDAIRVSSFEDYAAKLETAHVVLDPVRRADKIWADATNLAFAQGLQVVEDKSLLSEVAGLVEWPVVLMGAIDAAFLDLPPEVLQTSMREHQKFFSVRNPKTGRIEKFITVANRETADHGATILAGNQKVLAARLSDAKFFWENDLRVARAGMDEWVRKLSDVTFHNIIGSQSERIGSVRILAASLALELGLPEKTVSAVEYAGEMVKADLASEMVYEFPELQGTMGKYYLLAAGQSPAIAAAAEEHYSPVGPGDTVPRNPISYCISLADKCHLLGSFWGIGELPTGSKDPFALRRAALGVIRVLLENDLRVSVSKICRDAIKNGVLSLHRVEEGFSQRDDADWEAETDKAERSLLAFFHDRLKVYLRDRGIRHDVIDACIAMPNNDDLTLLVKRATALSDFLKTDDGENLLQGFKRANNILAQAEARDGVEYSYGADAKFASAAEEKALFTALETQGSAISSAIEAEDFASAMTGMASLRAPIDAFFEAVQVNDDNQIIRRNRLNLLSRIRQICLSVADLTRIEG